MVVRAGMALDNETRLNAGAFVRAWRRPVVPLGNVIAILGEGRRS